jgi:acyl-CoA synthetase (AMP-forming)/AMP-acid ligase II
MEVKIVDPQTGCDRLTPDEGEIAVRGATLMRGYYKTPPDETFEPDGFFRTGDAGWLDEQGYLHWTGRLSNLIKTGGAGVSPLEIERALADFPGLGAAVAVGVPHATLGQEVVLCAVPAAGAALDEAELRDFLRGRLAPYKIPRRVLLFRLDEVQLTGTQKIRSDALRDAAAARLGLDRQ